ncbi:conserved protein kinase [Elephant endotheliotropic herpesvirus 3B]|nr:conserved protein kinase [Elephant endotheliotropic herpesvirus 3B]
MATTALAVPTSSQHSACFKKYRRFFVRNIRLFREAIITNTSHDSTTRRKCCRSENPPRQKPATSVCRKRKCVSERRTLMRRPSIRLTCCEVSLSSSSSSSGSESGAAGTQRCSSSTATASRASEDEAENGSSIRRKRTVTRYLQKVECDEGYFKNIQFPTIHSETTRWTVVYVPECFSNCQAFCAKPRKRLLGAGSYGEAYRTEAGVTKKVFSNNELLVEAYLYAKVRTLENWETLSEYLRLPASVCFSHSSVSYVFYHTDLYHFNRHSIDALQNYRDIFAKLCDALCFLNLKCHLVHGDVSASNILINVDGEYITSAVIGDYSLTSRHDRRRAIIVMNESTGKSLGICQQDLQVNCTYQIVYRPISLMFWCVTIPELSIWRLCRNSREFCVMDLCAMGRVVMLFCLNLIHYETGLSIRKGMFDVNRKYENEPSEEKTRKTEYGIHALLNCLWIITCLCSDYHGAAGSKFMTRLIETFPNFAKPLTVYTKWLEAELPFRGVGAIVENKYGKELIDFICQTCAIDDFRQPLKDLFGGSLSV